MTEKEDIRRFSLQGLEERQRKRPSQSRPDAPVYPVDEAFWANARILEPSVTKTSVHLRIDPDVLAWFKTHGKGHLTRMNAVLRAYMDAHKPRS